MSSSWKVPFTLPDISAEEEGRVLNVLRSGALAGGGAETRACQQLLTELTGAHSILLTQSCTAALEMAALLTGVGEGDEVIMPSYTFVSTANAFVLRGATPVFVDVSPETLNIDPAAVRDAVTERTRVIVPVHYAGVSCDMDALLEIAAAHDLYIVEDAAQGLMSYLGDRHLGTFGDLGAFSFHNTKNLSSGEGGALAINNPELVERAEILWEKGTDRSRFMRGEVDKYSWVDVGSSFLPSEMTAALLHSQLVRGKDITQRRLAIWHRYHVELVGACNAAGVRQPVIPEKVTHNAHMYYLLARDAVHQEAILASLREAGVQAVFHYVPLHTSQAGRRFAESRPSLPVTERCFQRVVRLPIWSGMTRDQVDHVIQSVRAAV